MFCEMGRRKVKLDCSMDKDICGNTDRNVIRDTSNPNSLSETEPQHDMIKMIKAMFLNFQASIKEDISEIRKEVTELKKSVEFMADKFENYSLEFEKVNNSILQIQEENKVLRFELDQMQQYSRRDNVILNGIPETNGECVYEIIKQITNMIGAKADYIDDISIAHRIPTKKQDASKPIIVKFTRRWIRDDWLRIFRIAAKEDMTGPGLALKDLNSQFALGRFFAGDHLTPQMKDVLNRTKEAANRKEYKYVWTKDCKIQVRKDESSRAIIINSFADISKL